MSECTKDDVRQERLTVGAGLKLETGAAGSVAGGGASSDLQQVRRVGLQAVQGHVAAAGSEDGVAGLLLLLPRGGDKSKRKIWLFSFQTCIQAQTPPLDTPTSLINYAFHILRLLSQRSPLIKQQQDLHTTSA